MTKVQFFGAAQEVTGSMFLVTTSAGKKILVDCGLHQGEKIAEQENYKAFPFDARKIDLVVVTHAHLDHIGRLPKLIKDGFAGRVVATAPTADLAHIVLSDAQELITEESARNDHDPLYAQEDVNNLIRHFDRLEYNVATTYPGVAVKLLDAGHILGSAIIELNVDGNTLVFSGDLGNDGSLLLPPRQTPSRAQFLVMESTYGGRVHEKALERSSALRQAVMQVVRDRGVLIVPAFAIERTQELLYEIDQLLKEHEIPRMPIFLDSPLAINATVVFDRYSNYWNKESQILRAHGDNFFRFFGLHMTTTVADSKKIFDAPNPKIIIAGSGMMEGGRVLHHLKHYLPRRSTTVLVVGYQAQRTLGRRLLDGAGAVKIHGEEIAVRAVVKEINGFSAHADQPQLVDWLRKFEQKPRKVYLVHGEPGDMEKLASNIKKELAIDVAIPKYGESAVC